LPAPLLANWSGLVIAPQNQLRDAGSCIKPCAQAVADIPTAQTAANHARITLCVILSLLKNCLN
jgi:hypothetical protein